MNQHEVAGTNQKEFKLSESKTVTFDAILKDKVTWTSDVTAIPMGILRTPQIWDHPIDMMVYLHFFTHSFGRNRRWCNMGVLELQKFCASPKKMTSRNTIRDALNRLAKKGLIECIEPEAANQKTKKWLVRTPVEANFGSCTKESWVSVESLTTQPNKTEPKVDEGEAPKKTKPVKTPPIQPDTGSKSDPVNNQPGQNVTLTGSISDPEGVKNRPGGGQNLTPTNISSKIPSKNLNKNPSSLSNPELAKTLESYFSQIRAPLTEKKERSLWSQIQNKNPDVTNEEFLECFKLVTESKDSKGNPIALPCLWMANGFDVILQDARNRIRSKQIHEEDRLKAQKATQEWAALEKTVTPEDAKLAKDSLRAMLGKTFTQPMPGLSIRNPQSDSDRRAFLAAQAQQIQQIAKFGNL